MHIGFKWGSCILFFFSRCLMNGMYQSSLPVSRDWLLNGLKLKWTLGNLLTHIIYPLKRHKRTSSLGLSPRLKTFCVYSMNWSHSRPSSLYGKWHSPGLIYIHTPREEKIVSFHNLNLKTPHRRLPVTTWFICPTPRPFNIGKDK